MKKIFKGLLLALFLASPGILKAGGSIKEGNVIVKPAQGIDFTQSVDVSDVDFLSMQAIYSDGTPVSHGTTGGSRSTGTITVSNFASLIAAKAQVTIRVSSNGPAALTGAILNINGALFREGIDWTIGASTLATAQSISIAINRNSGFQSTHTLTASAIITASAAVAGSAFNAYTITSSTPTAIILGAATLTGGQDNAVIQFPTLGVTMTQGTDWNASASNAVTALNISTSINNNAILSPLIISSRPAVSSIIYASATFNGNFNYPISVSTPSALTVSGFGLIGGTDAEISSSTDRITHTNHLLTTGLAVLLSTNTGSAAPGGLTINTTYFAIYVDPNIYKLATTTTNAAAGTAIDITSLPVTVSSYTITPTPLVTAAGNGFFWQASNDNTNFSSLTSATISSVTYSTAGNTIWDFQRFGYKYLRAVFTGPTRGAIALTVKQYGKKD